MADGAFLYLESMPAVEVASCLREDPPLFAAVVLGRLSPAFSAKVLANMTAERQRDVVAKMGKSRIAPAEVVERIDAALRKRTGLDGAGEPERDSPSGARGHAAQAWRPRVMPDADPVNAPGPAERLRREEAIQNALQQARRKKIAAGPSRSAAAPASLERGGRRIDGAAIAAEILRFTTADVRKNIAVHEPGLYENLRRRMFSFDDLEHSPDETLARVFMEISVDLAALSLRFASPRLSRRVFAAVSPRRATLIQDEIENSARGRVRLEDVERAQNDVIQAAMRLQAAGQVIIDMDDPDLVG